MSIDKNRFRFDALRAAYLAKKANLDDYENGIRRKYGGAWNRSWLRNTEEKRLAQKTEATDKARRKFFDFVMSISPRDWNYGVPYHWICEELTYEDAVRPLDEKLSVVPPLAYGYTEHRT